MKEYPWGHKRRFNSYTEYMKGRFGGRVQKLTLDAGFTCPNRDGSRGRGGCTFCNNDAFSPAYCEPGRSIPEQLRMGMNYYKKRYRRVSSYLAYFQAYTNTYGDPDDLIPLYEQAVEYPGIIGLVVGTRPDCMPDELLDYFERLSRRKYVVIEYGIESCFNTSLERVNRGHTFEESVRALERTAGRGIRQGGHFIIGLPGESRADIIGEIKTISALPLNSVKFHQLQVVRDTKMEKQFRSDPDSFLQFSLEGYLELMVEILELLNPSVLVDRIAGEVNPGYLAGPSWNIRYDKVLRRFEDLLSEMDSWQGKHYTPH
jgi:radical SAM protein (TIGR01212 family)